MARQTEKLKTEIEKKNEVNKTVDVGLPKNEKRLMKDCVNMKLREKMQTSESEGVSSGKVGKGKQPQAAMDVSDDGN